MSSTVTYSPEDNKLRLYVGRVPRDEYEALRAAGFVSTPKQDCDFVAVWTPAREDLAAQYLEDGEDIGDEDYSPEERAADKAERLSGYRDKRRDEAGARADTFAAGPSAFGHQSRARAERQATRHDRHRTHAVSQWSKAEYWQMRTEGVIAHALHKSDAATRRGRILTLEAEQRKHENSRTEYAERFAAWSKVATLEGAGVPVVIDKSAYGITAETLPAGRLAYTLANSGGCWGDYQHPRNGERKASLYSLLTDPVDPVTPAEAAALWLGGRKSPDDGDSWSARWSVHYELRLTYERAMLASEGGTAAEADIEPGGWIRGVRTRSALTDAAGGWLQVHTVNKSPATGRVVSVRVMGTWSGYTRESNHTKYETRPALVLVNVERLGEDCYRAPTDEERAAFATETKQRKAEAKAKKPKAPSLINPTDADAERLQGILNAIGKQKHDAKRGTFGEPYKPTEVLRMTQAQYSAASKGSYSHYETRTVHESGNIIERHKTDLWTREGSDYDKGLGAPVCKVRARYCSGWNNPPHIVVLTDAAQKPLPVDWEKLMELAPEAAPVAAGQLF